MNFTPNKFINEKKKLKQIRYEAKKERNWTMKEEQLQKIKKKLKRNERRTPNTQYI
jgi:hypothetical protein